MPEIKQITLPSGNTYDIKDATARTAIASNSADIEELRSMISGGVSFNIVWTQADWASTSAPSNVKLSGIPEGVKVYYGRGLEYATGTLAASNTTVGKFYLIYSNTQTLGDQDYYDEYVTVGTTTKSWEKIGDTQIQLNGVVTDVELNQSTKSVIGTGATFNVTQPDIELASVDSSTDGSVYVVGALNQQQYWIGATANSGNVSFNNKDSKTVLTGATASTSYIYASVTGGGVTLNAKTANALTGATASYLYAAASATNGSVSWNTKDARVVVNNVTKTSAYIHATATGGGADWNSKDSQTVVTSVAASTSNLETVTIYGVSAATTTAAKVSSSQSQTTATGSGTPTSDNMDWLKGISVSDEVLVIGAAAMNTQWTKNYTFSDVTVPIKNDTTTTVATGGLVASGGGATIATNVSIGSSVNVIGENATLTNTQPTVSLESGDQITGSINVLQNVGVVTTSAIGFNATLSFTQPTISLSLQGQSGTGRVRIVDSISVSSVAVLSSTTGVSHTNPTVNLAKTSESGTGRITFVYGLSTTTTTAIGSSATFSVTQPTIALAMSSSFPEGQTPAGAIQLTQTNQIGKWIGATASGGSVTWASKDSATVLTSGTSLTVTKGGSLGVAS